MSQTREERREKDRARKHSYGRDCLGCGKRTDGSNGRAKAPLYCIQCFNQLDHKKFWTEETITEAIRLYAHRYNRAPSATDWNPAMARRIGRHDWADRFYADGDYPHTNSVRSVFGSWSASIAAAGYEPRGIGKRGPARPS